MALLALVFFLGGIGHLSRAEPAGRAQLLRHDQLRRPWRAADQANSALVALDGPSGGEGAFEALLLVRVRRSFGAEGPSWAHFAFAGSTRPSVGVSVESSRRTLGRFARAAQAIVPNQAGRASRVFVGCGRAVAVGTVWAWILELLCGPDRAEVARRAGEAGFGRTRGAVESLRNIPHGIRAPELIEGAALILERKSLR